MTLTVAWSDGASTQANRNRSAASVREGTFQLASKMTLLLLLVASPPYWYVKAPLMGAALGGLLVSRVREARWFWMVICAVLFTSNYHHWHFADNHKHLLAYWCLSILVTLKLQNRDRRLGTSARLLIGLSFFLAFAWKLNGQFASGNFFHYTLLFDPRFRSVAEVVGGLSPSAYEMNLEAHRQLSELSLQTLQPIASGPWLLVVARGMAWWTLAIEGAVALVFLCPSHVTAARQWGSPLLLCFVATTYFFAPVLGFAYVLICLGITTLEGQAEFKRYRAPYILAFAGVSLYSMPWRQLAQALSGGHAL